MNIVMLRDTVVDGKAVQVGDKVKTSDENAIMLITMGKASLASEKSKKPTNRDDTSEKLSTR